MIPTYIMDYHIYYVHSHNVAYYPIISMLMSIASYVIYHHHMIQQIYHELDSLYSIPSSLLYIHSTSSYLATFEVSYPFLYYNYMVNNCYELAFNLSNVDFNFLNNQFQLTYQSSIFTFHL
jgi:hypothetical protein